MGPIIKKLAENFYDSALQTKTYRVKMDGRSKCRIYFSGDQFSGSIAKPDGSGTFDNDTLAPTIALSVLPVIPDFYDVSNSDAQSTVAWPLSSGNDEPYVFPETGSIAAFTVTSLQNKMIMVETPVGELEVSVTHGNNGTLHYSLIAELV